MRTNATEKGARVPGKPLIIVSCWMIFASTAFAGGAVDGRFQRNIAPLLAKHCLECHTETTKKGGLDLTQRKTALAGGDSGKVILPRHAAKSLLWKYVNSNEMPKERPPLSKAEKQLLRKWIDDGAAWGSKPIDPLAYSSSRRAGYDWWSLQPVRSFKPPAVKDRSWPVNDVDHFILHRLEAKRLHPAPQADRRTLIRRLYFDLLGLPPSPEAVDRFVRDKSSNAYEKLVDELLKSPHYGERWARHWLDVVRFGESQGYERNRIRDYAWKYRDWVIDAFNRDMPYDEFVRKQIAGDVLYPKDKSALIATGYHVCGTWDQVGHLEGSQTMRKAARWDHLEDLVATLGQAYLGLTINCARCHDHKFDPVSQREYYQIAALLGGVTQVKDEPHKLHVVVAKQPPVFHRLARGDMRNPKEAVSPAGLKALSRGGLSPDFKLKPNAPEAKRRVALAKWLTDRRNPLIARVFVNRLWHYHFGTGIVDTPSDFGFNGGRPSHPQLLDYLAERFMQNSWKVKSLQRLIVMSATYRQRSRIADSHSNPQSIDSENRLLWRFNRRRLEGEAVRDAVLAVSGALNPKLGGLSYRDMKVGGGKMGTNAEFTEPTNAFTPDTCRRTIYRLWARAGNNPRLQSLDCPDPSVMMPRRPGTITPLQALALLNSPFIDHCADRFAMRVRKEAGKSPAAQITRAYRLALQRPPTKHEAALASLFVSEHGLKQFCLVLLNTNEFLFVD